jgi:hypothetical protein
MTTKPDAGAGTPESTMPEWVRLAAREIVALVAAHKPRLRTSEIVAIIVARHAEIGGEPQDTTGRPESTGFEVQVKIHTKDGDSVISAPGWLRHVIGKAVDAFGVQEEIDYTLEVRRVYR